MHSPKKMGQRLSLRRPDVSVAKIVAVTLVTVTTLVLSAFGIVSCWLESKERVNELQRDLNVHTLQLKSSLALPLWNFDADQVDKIIESSMQDREVFAVLIREAGGGRIRRAFARDDKWRSTASNGEIAAQELLSQTAELSIYQNRLGTVQVFMTKRFMQESLRDFLLQMTAGIVLLEVSLVFLLFRLLRKTVIQPLKEIESYALAVKAGGAQDALIGEEGYFGELFNLRLAIVDMTVSLATAKDELVHKLEERVRERTRALQEAQHELVTAARHAGMAEIASNVLHNVGNVLNSVNISAGLVLERLRASRVPGLLQAVDLMREHHQELGDYLSRDEKGQLLPEYLQKLALTLASEQQLMAEELSRLTKSVDHIKEIVTTQQSYAGCASVIEPVQVRDLVEDALRMNLGDLTRHQITVVREFAALPILPLDKGRVLQILVNLISNARQAMDATRGGPRRITLRAELVDGSRLRLSVSDEGEGIDAANLSRIFSHGFTTKKGGHGFGLHSCALAAREMGGTLTAQSAGPGLGASFTLEVPVPPPAHS